MCFKIYDNNIAGFCVCENVHTRCLFKHFHEESSIQCENDSRSVLMRLAIRKRVSHPMEEVASLKIIYIFAAAFFHFFFSPSSKKNWINEHEVVRAAFPWLHVALYFTLFI